MPLIFSYGSLQQESVQLRTYGRKLHGTPDHLVGFAQVMVPIVDAARQAVHQQTHYANVAPMEDSTRTVSGTVFEITADELLATDRYEALDHYVRIEAQLGSGLRAWVYVHAHRGS